jgi:hypothetical protein
VLTASYEGRDAWRHWIEARQQALLDEIESAKCQLRLDKPISFQEQFDRMSETERLEALKPYLSAKTPAEPALTGEWITGPKHVLVGGFSNSVSLGQ